MFSLWICIFVKRPPRNQKNLLLESQEKHKSKKNQMLKKLEIPAEKIEEKTQTTKGHPSFAAASLGTFKSSRVRRVALFLRSGISNMRPPREDPKQSEKSNL